MRGFFHSDEDRHETHHCVPAEIPPTHVHGHELNDLAALAFMEGFAAGLRVAIALIERRK